MTLRIESSSTGRRTTVRLFGRIQSEQLDELKAQIEGGGSEVMLDLVEVTLVDVDVVHFLGDCEGKGITILNCPRYIREWMVRERTVGG